MKSPRLRVICDILLINPSESFCRNSGMSCKWNVPIGLIWSYVQKLILGSSLTSIIHFQSKCCINGTRSAHTQVSKPEDPLSQQERKVRVFTVRMHPFLIRWHPQLQLAPITNTHNMSSCSACFSLKIHTRKNTKNIHKIQAEQLTKLRRTHKKICSHFHG